jgi:hypothetical protein
MNTSTLAASPLGAIWLETAGVATVALPTMRATVSVWKGACGVADCVAHLAQRVGVSHAAFHVLPRLPQFPALWLSQTHGTYTSSRLKHGLCRGSQDVSYVLSPRYIDSRAHQQHNEQDISLDCRMESERDSSSRNGAVERSLTRLGACLKRKQSRESDNLVLELRSTQNVNTLKFKAAMLVSTKWSLVIVPGCDLALGTRSRPNRLKRAAARMRGLCHLPRSLMRSHFPRDLVKFSKPATEQGVLLQDPHWFGANTRDIILVLAPRYRTPRTRTRYLQSERPTNLELTQ